MKLKKKEKKIIKDKTKTERFPTKVGNLNKEKTKRKQKGFRLKSETLITRLDQSNVLDW